MSLKTFKIRRQIEDILKAPKKVIKTKKKRKSIIDIQLEKQLKVILDNDSCFSEEEYLRNQVKSLLKEK